jgi:hypothetical protein
VLHYRAMPWVWARTAPLLASAARATGLQLLQGEICHTIAFLLIIIVANMALELPWSLWRTFVVEQRHGFNKQTLALYMSDLYKQACGGLAAWLPGCLAAWGLAGWSSWLADDAAGGCLGLESCAAACRGRMSGVAAGLSRARAASGPAAPALRRGAAAPPARA